MTDTLASLVAAARERDGVAVEFPERATPYSYPEFATAVWKTANLLGQFGVHEGSEVAVVSGSGGGDLDVGKLAHVEPLYAILGSTRIGACANLDPTSPVESRALVRSAGQKWHKQYHPTPRCSVLAYGGESRSTDEEEPASVTQFEGAVWGQNPTEPPETVTETQTAVVADGRSYTHETLLAGADWIVSRYGLGESDRVGVMAPLTNPGTVVAGVLAPLSVGATIVPGEESEVSLVVGHGGDKTIDPETVTEELDSHV